MKTETKLRCGECLCDHCGTTGDKSVMVYRPEGADQSDYICRYCAEEIDTNDGDADSFYR